MAFQKCWRLPVRSAANLYKFVPVSTEASASAISHAQQRRRSFSRTGWLGAAPLLIGMLAFGQAKPAPVAGRPATISLDVVVTPKKGGPVGGLTQKDFTVLDNKVPVPITSFRAIAGRRAPVEVLLVIDAVNIPYTEVSYMRGEIEKFLRANDGQLPLPTSLAIFSDTAVQMQPGFTRDGNGEADALNHATIALREITRSTGFWGATERFQNSLTALGRLAQHEAALPGRKLMIWASPGWPLLSGPAIDLDNRQQARFFSDIVRSSAQLQMANITLYNVNPIGAVEGPARSFYYQNFLKGVSRPAQVDAADLSLQVLATQSGGLVLTSSNDLVGELQRCYDDALDYYQISFQAAHPERRDEYHSIQVQVAQPGLTARTRQGYYAQP